MPDWSPSPTEPLLGQVISPSARWRKKLSTRTWLLIGLGFTTLGSQVACTLGRGWQHLSVKASAIAMSCINQGWVCQQRLMRPGRGRPVTATAEVIPCELGALSEFVTTSSGVQMPRIIYGAIWKDEPAQDFVQKAVRAGFRGLDAARQQLNRRERTVGASLASLFAAGVERDHLYIQIVVDPSYAEELNPSVPISRQVELFIADSLSNLKLKHADSLLLHEPYPQHQQTMEAWRAMEDALRAGLVRQLGIANVASLAQLQIIYKDATLKPAIVKKRAAFSAVARASELDMLRWCIEVGIYFQTFGILTANKNLIGCETMQDLAAKYDVTPKVLFRRFVLGLGVVQLCDMSRDDEQLKIDLAAWRVDLSAQDANTINDLLMQMLPNVDSGLVHKGGLNSRCRNNRSSKDAAVSSTLSMLRKQVNIQLPHDIANTHSQRLGRIAGKGKCMGCLLLRKYCTCSAIAALGNDVRRYGIVGRHRFVVWMHAKERWRASNTGRLVASLVPGSELLIDGVSEDVARLEELLADAQGRVCVLWPSGESLPVANISGVGHPLLVVLIDGTWQQADRMSQSFAGLPRVSLSQRMLSAYCLRRPKQEQPHYLSTIEAAALLLEELGEPAGVVESLRSALEVLTNSWALSTGTPIVSSIECSEKKLT